MVAGVIVFILGYTTITSSPWFRLKMDRGDFGKALKLATRIRSCMAAISLVGALCLLPGLKFLAILYTVELWAGCFAGVIVEACGAPTLIGNLSGGERVKSSWLGDMNSIIRRSIAYPLHRPSACDCAHPEKHKPKNWFLPADHSSWKMRSWIILLPCLQTCLPCLTSRKLPAVLMLPLSPKFRASRLFPFPLRRLLFRPIKVALLRPILPACPLLRRCHLQPCMVEPGRRLFQRK